MARFFLLFVPGILIACAVIIYFTWYQHAVSGDSPYDEIFIEINTYMPAFARDWACETIAERFPGSQPPYTCGPEFGA